MGFALGTKSNSGASRGATPYCRAMSRPRSRGILRGLTQYGKVKAGCDGVTSHATRFVLQRVYKFYRSALKRSTVLGLGGWCQYSSIVYLAVFRCFRPVPRMFI